MTAEGWRYELEANQHRRCHGHDYSAPGTYLITIVVAGGARIFGHVEGDPRAKKGEKGFAALVPSPLGQVVLTEERPKIHRYYPMVEVWHFCLMPDHIHMILRVKEALPPKKHLGHLIGAFMGGISRAWWRLQEQPSADAQGTRAGGEEASRQQGGGQAAPPSAQGTRAGDEEASQQQGGEPAARTSAQGTRAEGHVSRALARDCRPPLFEQGYNDHILARKGQLECWKAYLDDNAHRLLLRQCYPDLMQRRMCIVIAGTRYSAFGNFMLLKRPYKVQGQCHVKARYGDLTEEERRRYGCPAMAAESKTHIAYEETRHFRDNYRRTMDAVRTRAAVLVTPGISEGEKMMKNDAIKERLPLIHLQKEPIMPRWKPEETRFYACVAGTLLILAPWADDIQATGDYATFHRLNDMAAALCAMDVSDMRDCRAYI